MPINVIKLLIKYITILDTIRKLCEDGLPVDQYFDLCANYILEYELIRKSGIMTEGTIDENQKNTINNINTNEINDNNKMIHIEDNGKKNISIEDKLKLGLEVKNESIKNI